MHLGRVEKRRMLRHLLSDRAQVDVCVVAETRFLEGRGQNLMCEIFSKEYTWYGKIEVDKRARGEKGELEYLCGMVWVFAKRLREVKCMNQCGWKLE